MPVLCFYCDFLLVVFLFCLVLGLWNDCHSHETGVRDPMRPPESCFYNVCVRQAHLAREAFEAHPQVTSLASFCFESVVHTTNGTICGYTLISATNRLMWIWSNPLCAQVASSRFRCSQNDLYQEGTTTYTFVIMKKQRNHFVIIGETHFPS